MSSPCAISDRCSPERCPSCRGGVPFAKALARERFDAVMTRETLRPRANSAANRRPSSGSRLANARVGVTSPGTNWQVGAHVGSTPSLARQYGGQFPLSVGVDLVTVAEVAAALDRFGDRYVRRVFTAREAAYCLAADGSVAAARLAARFAAKEAAIKALQPERPWTDWCAIEVRRRRSGRCAIVLHGEAASLAARRGIQQIELSMSHEGDLAAAVVIALRATTIHRAHEGKRRHAACDHR